MRLVKKAFTSGWVNRSADVAAETPDMMPARSAAVQLGDESAAAVAAVPISIAPAMNPVATEPVTTLPEVRGGRHSCSSWNVRRLSVGAWTFGIRAGARLADATVAALEIAVEPEVVALPVVRAIKRDDGTGHRLAAPDRALPTHADSTGVVAVRRGR